MTLAAGSRLGPYEILAPLGAGGMGEVYRARDTRLSREVAIKVLPAELASDASRLKRFEKEARSASALNHPNIVTIYDIGSEGGVSYIAMERVEGATLRELLVGGALPMRRLFQIAPQIAEGLSKAHEAGIVHRDLKPENVMVTKDGLVKILDFGLAKLSSRMSGSGEGSELPTMTGTTPGVVVGTVGYMSPEQASGMQLDFRSDQFSLGSILYEMTTGRRAFQKKTAIDTLAAILNEEPEAIAKINPQAPAPLRWIVERCLSKEPENRYAATRDLARELSVVRDHLSEAVSGPAAIAAVPRSKKRLRVGALVASSIVAGVLAGKLLWKTPAQPPPSYQRLTFRRGFVDAARFSTDGRTILYSARWDGDRPYIFLTRPESPESQRLDLPSASVMALSSRGEIALVTGKPMIGLGWWFDGGTLATVPLAGGAPREIAEDVRFADWTPDGSRLLAFRGEELQFPVGGRVIHRGQGVHPRFSPSGDKVAFIEGSRVHVVDLDGKELLTSTRGRARYDAFSLAWSPTGREVWFAAGTEGGHALRALSLGGRERTALVSPRGVAVQDLSRDGRMLIAFHEYRSELWAGSTGEGRERNLTVFGQSNAMGISADGKLLLDNEKGAFYLRYADGSPSKKLGEGFGSELSADGKWAVVIRPGPPEQLVLVPTGAGAERPLERGNIEAYNPLDVRWSLDGRRLAFAAHEHGKPDRLHVQEVAGGAPRPVPGEGGEIDSLSPDGRFVLVQNGNDFWIYPTDGGDRRRANGFLPTDYVWKSWSPDARYAYAWNVYELPYRVFRVELATGRRELWKTITPQDPTGIWNADLLVTPDGKSYAYNCQRDQSDLYLVEGIR